MPSKQSGVKKKEVQGFSYQLVFLMQLCEVFAAVGLEPDEQSDSTLVVLDCEKKKK